MAMSEGAVDQTRRSPLWNAQASIEGRLTAEAGWEMVEYYTSSRDEHQAVRNSVGLIDLSHHGAIRIGGKEGPQFLQGLVTNDVKALAPLTGMRCAFLTGHGKVRALARVVSLGEEYLIITDPPTHEKVLEYVFPFSYAGDFKVDDVSDQHRILSVQGPNALLVMKEVCFEPVPRLDEHQAIRTMIAGKHVLVVKASHTGEEGYDILIPAGGLKDVWDFVLLKGAFHSIRPVGFSALDHLRIEAGIPVYGVDVDERNMMLETGLTDAVSFTKGCYTGQEAVAMATYRGHVSKRLSGLKLSGGIAPSSGDAVHCNDKEIGHVTSALVSQSLDAAIAMAYLKYGFFEPDLKVAVVTAKGRLEGRVVELPFYRRVTG